MILILAQAATRPQSLDAEVRRGCPTRRHSRRRCRPADPARAPEPPRRPACGRLRARPGVADASQLDRASRSSAARGAPPACGTARAARASARRRARARPDESPGSARWLASSNALNRASISSSLNGPAPATSGASSRIDRLRWLSCCRRVCCRRRSRATNVGYWSAVSCSSRSATISACTSR